MKYYKVKPEYDNQVVCKFDKRSDCWKYDGILVGNELYTEKEYSKLYRLSNIHSGYFDIVEIPKTRVYWCFGARLECKLS